MILREATIKYKGYDPIDLSKGSNKRICCSCDKCGRVRWVIYQDYRDLCHNCSSKLRSGKNHHFYGKFGKDHPRGGKPAWNKNLTKNNNKSIKIISEKNKNKNIGINNSNYKLEIDQFVKDNIGKHFCTCGCGEEIQIKRKYFNTNIPKYIRGHSFKGENNPNYGKFGKESSGWKGGIAGIRDHILPEWKCIKLNERFSNSNFHHLSRSIGIYIPSELHNHFYHNLKSGQGIYEMNMLAYQYLKGGI